MEDTKKISKIIFDKCYLVDKNIVGLSDEDARSWAKVNSVRHACCINEILNYSRRTGKKKLSILNASGIACGHQDFSIMFYLDNFSDLDISWTVFDSPKNPFLENFHFKEGICESRIDLRLVDFKKEENVFGTGLFDLVIFSEIAEHLDHSVLLSSLGGIRKVINEDGRLFFTTPNLTSIINRVRIFCGNGDEVYFGDGTENLSKGLYGHVAIYDHNRLRRILMDVGFEIEKNTTYNFGLGPDEKKLSNRILFKFVKLICQIVKNAGKTHFIIAKKAIPKKIPFRI